jgi:hypothetical protein
MNTPKMVDAMNHIDDDLVSAAITYTKAKKRQWIKWVSLAACLCVLLVGAAVWKNMGSTQPPKSGGTLPGDTEVYPTVMVDGKLYEWRKGRAICVTVPEDLVHCGQIIHVDKNRLKNDCEFRAIFDVSGDIYICPSDGCVYICITTDWMEDTFVVFDPVKTE